MTHLRTRVFAVRHAFQIFLDKNILFGVYSNLTRWAVSEKNLSKGLTTLSALAEPNRLQIVELLRDGPLTVGEIAGRLELRQPQASKHLKVLADKGILEVKADANRRIYRLKPEPFMTLDTWVKSFQRVMEERFNNLDEYLQKLKTKEKNKNRSKR
jgi:DNA-binding transcriptional ArsR family regulator